MSKKITTKDTVLEFDLTQGKNTQLFFPSPPLLTSYQAGWKSVQLSHFKQNGFDSPEFTSNVHVIVMANWKQSSEVTMVADGKRTLMICEEDQSGFIEIVPANLPIQSRCTREVEFTQCYFNPAFLQQVAYESVDPDRVEFVLMLQQPDPLLWQMGAALKTVLENNPKNSSFYADSIATAFAAHLLTHYATRKHNLQQNNGLPKQKLKQAIEYINEHLGDDISLSDLAGHLLMSQHHFSLLFKQSMGVTAHTYLVQQRVKRAKELLHQTDLSIVDITYQCGFANPSHLAKHFRRQVGITPREFRLLR
jgi:AraC family transcriptional regulator